MAWFEMESGNETMSFLLLTPLPLSLPHSLSHTRTVTHTATCCFITRKYWSTADVVCRGCNVTASPFRSLVQFCIIHTIHRVDWYAVCDYNYHYYSITLPKAIL